MLFCAEWCNVCCGFRPAWLAWQARQPSVAARWSDIETDSPEGLEIDDLPMLALFVGDRLTFLGSVPASTHVLDRLLRAASDAPVLPGFAARPLITWVADRWPELLSAASARGSGCP